MSDWYPAGLEDDLRPRMFAAADRGEAFALVTIVAADGGGPRGIGAQMVVTVDDAAGFLSGGCIEADVMLHARAVLQDGHPQQIVYGRGSPFVDTRLPCGGRLELQVERIGPDDTALATLRDLTRARRPAAYVSNGTVRRTEEAGSALPIGARLYLPGQRLLVFGFDPFALAIADLGRHLGWDVILARPKGPDEAPPLAVTYVRGAPAQALAALRPDVWTAVAVATHDADLDHEALVAALGSGAGYVGVLGARRRLPERLARLRQAGVSETDLARLRAPIGLDLGARAPQDVAVAVVAEIIAGRRDAR